ncbi:hypothetical protein FACS1894191_4580 [Clostridia bacterium]|nr:hypothetical protein FACS1894191_4580 [Clostridia bacterium]
MSENTARSTLSILARNEPGTLVKVATVISGRGLNIHEMIARVSNNPQYTLINIDFLGDTEKLRQVQVQLEKLEVVKEVTPL